MNRKEKITGPRNNLTKAKNKIPALTTLTK